MKQINTSEIYKQITNAPEVVAAEQRLANVRNRLKAVEAEIERLQNQVDTSRNLESNEMAQTLLYDGDADGLAIESLQTELSKAQETAALLAKAVKLGEQEFDFAKRNVASTVLQGLQPELKARQAALIGKYAECAIATREYRELLLNLQAAGVEPSFDHFYTGGLSNAAEHNSSFFTWCGGLIERNLLAKNDIPESLRKFWEMV